MKALIGSFVIAVVVVLSGWAEDHRKPLVLIVEQTKDSPAYHLDNADVSDDPLRRLGLAIQMMGEDSPLTIAVDSRLPINTLWNAGALAGKAGFVNIRYYAFRTKIGKGLKYLLESNSFQFDPDHTEC